MARTGFVALEAGQHLLPADLRDGVGGGGGEQEGGGGGVHAGLLSGAALAAAAAVASACVAAGGAANLLVTTGSLSSCRAGLAAFSRFRPQADSRWLIWDPYASLVELVGM